MSGSRATPRSGSARRCAGGCRCGPGPRSAGVAGRGRLAGVEVADVRTGAARFVPCDTVVFTGDWIPDHELARRAGLAMDPGTRGPVVDTSAGDVGAGRVRRGQPGARGRDRGHRRAVRPARAPGRSPPRSVPEDRTLRDRVAEGRARGRARGACRSWSSRRCGGSRRTRSRPMLFGPSPAGPVRAAQSGVPPLARLEVRQDGRLLARSRVTRLVPERPVHLGAAWLARVDPAGRSGARRFTGEQPRYALSG